MCGAEYLTLSLVGHIGTGRMYNVVYARTVIIVCFLTLYIIVTKGNTYIFTTVAPYCFTGTMRVGRNGKVSSQI